MQHACCGINTSVVTDTDNELVAKIIGVAVAHHLLRQGARVIHNTGIDAKTIQSTTTFSFVLIPLLMSTTTEYYWPFKAGHFSLIYRRERLCSTREILSI